MTGRKALAAALAIAGPYMPRTNAPRATIRCARCGRDVPKKSGADEPRMHNREDGAPCRYRGAA